MAAPTLTQDDVRILREMASKVRELSARSERRARHDEIQDSAPEVYVARVPDAGIPGLTVDAGTASVRDEPGSALCDIYTYQPAVGKMSPTGMQRLVYNLSTDDVDPDNAPWIPVARDKYGIWWATDIYNAAAAGATTTIDTWPVTETAEGPNFTFFSNAGTSLGVNFTVLATASTDSIGFNMSAGACLTMDAGGAAFTAGYGLLGTRAIVLERGTAESPIFGHVPGDPDITQTAEVVFKVDGYGENHSSGIPGFHIYLDFETYPLTSGIQGKLVFETFAWVPLILDAATQTVTINGLGVAGSGVVTSGTIDGGTW